EMACALRLFEVKSRCNLTDDAFWQTMLAVNNGNISQFRIKKKLKFIKHIQCEYCGTPRYQNATSNIRLVSRRQMAYFSIKTRLKIQYQDPIRSQELSYRANYTCRQGFGLNDNIGDIFDGTRYQELLSSNLFQDERD
ncbi:14557_t:CDS:2, partial [Funneliformis geosporum]